MARSVTDPPGPLPRHTLPEPVPTFLMALQVERGASRHTLQAYRRDLSDFVRFLGRRRRVTAVTPDDLIAYLQALRARGLRRFLGMPRGGRGHAAHVGMGLGYALEGTRG